MTNNVNQRSASNYHRWLLALKTRFRQVQLKAAVAVNTEQWTAIPWGHKLAILSKCQTHDQTHNQALDYIPVDFEPEFAGKLNCYRKAVGFQQEYDDGR